MKSNNVMLKFDKVSKSDYVKELSELSVGELHEAVGKTVMGEISDRWKLSKEKHMNRRRAYYFSAEFLMGRMIYNNLYSLGMLKEVKTALSEKGIDIAVFEDIEDAALGNGGLGRLAACFLDSAATHDIPLDGYGIRYKYGLFRQMIKHGFQVEVADNWQKDGDPWSIRRNDDTVTVKFADQEVNAVPYDMAVIGYGTDNINTLRLWQCEAKNEFDFVRFNNQEYVGAVKERIDAENISNVLYPNDNSYEGKVLRLKQQYFFTSASLQDIIKRYKKSYGDDYSRFSQHCAIQLNDTHPVVAIPELIRLLGTDGVGFEEAFEISQKTFSYTNHTIMAEALEKWDVALFKSVIPEVYRIVEKIDERLQAELNEKEIRGDELKKMLIVENNRIHMARLAIYVSSHINGVAKIHTEILKGRELREWYKLYPERFQNKTNGITQRRWLALSNPELSDFITKCIGDGWIKDLSYIDRMKSFINDDNIERFNEIKQTKKRQLADYIKKKENISINPDSIFDIQVKRLHEYKRQLLNAFSILYIYFGLKDGSIRDFTPTTFIFGAKAAPGYARAKSIIKYINEIARLVNNDKDVNDRLKVVFVSNYNCSYAEKLVVAADISEQISTAGTEASGTGNMKFMLNGTVTLGTFDGANVEIVEQAGEENNYIFGARVEELDGIKESYNPKKIYRDNAKIKRVVDTLIDGTFSDGGTEVFEELYDSLLEGASWHRADNYFLLYDLESYVKAKLKANTDYKDRIEFGRKCMENMAGAGKFSSDRTIKEYSSDLWHLV